MAGQFDQFIGTGSICCLQLITYQRTDHPKWLQAWIAIYCNVYFRVNGWGYFAGNYSYSVVYTLSEKQIPLQIMVLQDNGN